MSVQDNLVKQILGQGLTGKWSGQGYGSAEANAQDMAKILAGIGITDINQFGKISVPVEEYVGTEYEGGPPVYQTRMQETFGNKETGQAVPNTYSERQTGNFFGGTFEGKGNTGYGVQFDAQGNPLFYTQGASSSDIGNIAPLLTMASFVPGLQPFAAGLNSLIAAKQGNVLGAIAGAAGLGGMTDVANAARFASAVQSGDPLAMAFSGANLGGITDVGGIDLKDISKTIGAVKAIESGDPLALLRYGMGAMSPDGKLTSSFGPGTAEEFSEGLIPGYFQPGGEGYISSADEHVFDPTFGGILPQPEADIPELVMTDKRDKTQEHVFDPTFGGSMPLPQPEDDVPELVMTDKRDKTQEHVFDPTFGGSMPLPTTPGTTPGVTSAPKAPAGPVKAPTASARPSSSSGMNLPGLMALLSSQQQPVQQAPMQDPYAHIKLMEDLFGSNIDLTPAGENTAQRK